MLFSKRPSILAYLVFFGLITLLPLVALLSYNSHSLQQAEQRDALTRIEPLRLAFAQQVHTYVRDLEIMLTHISRLPAMQQPDQSLALAMLQRMRSVRPDLANLLVLDQEGRVLNSVVPSPTTAGPGVRPWISEALAAEAFTTGSAFLDPETKTWTCLLSHPLHDNSGNRIGTLVVPLNLLSVSRRFFSAHTSPESVATVFDARGRIIMSSHEPALLIGTPSIRMYPAFRRNELRQFTGTYTDSDHVDLFFTIGPVADTAWANSISIPREVIFASAAANRRRSLWLVGAFAVVLGSAIFWLARYLNRPIASLAAAARAEIAGQSAQPALVAGPAEIAETARAFNEMVATRDLFKAALAANERRYRTVIDLVPHFIYAKDAAGRFTLVNEAVARLFGTTPDQLLGKSAADFPHRAEEDRLFNAQNAAVLASGQPLTIPEERYTAPNGQVRYFSTVKIPFNPGGSGEPSVLGVSVDITALKQAAEERHTIETKLLETQKLESLGVLAGGIAHDFNNLLTGILGNAGLARLDLPAHSPTADYLAQIEKTSLRAADLCKQMLAYSGKGRFVIQNLDLNELLRDSTQLLTISIHKKSALRFDLATTLPPIQADATQLRQVLMNLVINASEAIGDRPGTILLSTTALTADATYLANAQLTAELPPGDYVCLEVGDDGTGMTPETVARIFDPFYTTKFTGRGLGLAAVHGIVHGHKGAIRVYSELGRGTTFKLYFPAAQGPADSLSEAAPQADRWQGSGRVLIVDDEEAVRLVSARVVKRLGYTVDTAADGLTGLEIFRTQPTAYTAVLLDLTMPRLDGEETFRLMRQLQPSVRIILMSGFNKVEAINRFLGKGLAGFVQKPFEVETLAAELRRVTENAAPKAPPDSDYAV